MKFSFSRWLVAAVWAADLDPHEALPKMTGRALTETELDCTYEWWVQLDQEFNFWRKSAA